MDDFLDFSKSQTIDVDETGQDDDETEDLTKEINA